jgi:hypothetical protein
VTDPQGAVVANAKVTVTNVGKNQSIALVTTSEGLYSSGSIVPGSYRVTVEAKGFHTAQLAVRVEVGSIASGSLKLEAGEESQIVKVPTEAMPLHSQQATVQGVVTSGQIDKLPFNGRDFFDLAQFEPGVQYEDGAGFETKTGFSSLSMVGRAGRTLRIALDGTDISDEGEGTTTQNISAASIQEFQIAQSTLDLSSSLTSSGLVNVVTKSGSDAYHGSGAYAIRDKNVGFAALPGGQAPYFQRNELNGNFGGPVVKDKVFFFVNAEHTKQDFGNVVRLNPPFTLLSGTYSAPYRDSDYLGRLDWTTHNLRFFYRLTYDDTSDLRPGGDFSPFLSRSDTPGQAIGVDFQKDSWAHTIRAGDSKYKNHILPPTVGGLLDPNPGLNLEIGTLQTGPNKLAPQANVQQNRQIRYDGSRASGNHVFRVGIAYDRIVENVFAPLGENAPTLQSAATPANMAAAVLGAAPALIAGDPQGAADNPLNYPIAQLQIYDGQGYLSEKPSLGLPHGGLFDNSIEFYAGDGWKAAPNATITLGLRYVRDTGRTNSDLPAIPALDAFCPGCGNRVRQPNKNFSPEIGIAWDPARNGRTVIRLGSGIYYENNLFSNVFLDRTLRLRSGLVPWSQATLCGTNGGIVPVPGGNVTSSDGLDIATQICGHAPSATVAGVNVGQAVIDLQKAYQAAAAAAVPGGQNFLFAGNLGSTFGLPMLFAPSYLSPRSLQINGGLERQLARGTVLSVDYVRNLGTHFPLGTDLNHVGAARNFIVANAATAIATTLAKCGAATVVQSYSRNCTLDPANGTTDGGTWGTAQNPARPLTMADYAANGLDSAGAFANLAAAFPGFNQTMGIGDMVQPAGRSLYQGVLISLRTNVDHPAHGVRHMSAQVSYALSRFKSDVPMGGDLIPGDQEFASNAEDWDHPLRYFGPAGLDRTHQASVGAIFDLVKGFQFGMIGHVDSPLPLTLQLPQLNGGGVPGEIFRSDFTGDGTVQDVLPGTNVGSFGRSIDPYSLFGVISRYNTTYAQQATPAGQALIGTQLMTLSDLQHLNGVYPTIQAPSVGNVGLGWLKSIDVRLGWTYKVGEHFSIQSSVAAFNVFNLSNFDSPFNLPSGVLSGQPAYSINTLTNQNTCPAPTCRSADRVAPGSGTYSLGAPRELEFSLKVNF